MVILRPKNFSLKICFKRFETRKGSDHFLYEQFLGTIIVLVIKI